MAEDDSEKSRWLPKINFNFNKKDITKRMRKVEGATIRHTHKFVIKRWANVREVQRNIIIWIIAMGLLIAATGLQLMWFQTSYRMNAPATDGVYAEAVLGPVDTLNPLFASSSAEQSAGYLMFSRLVNYDQSGHLNYDLATSIKINDSKTAYTVKIRPDIKWHDGEKLTTSDIAFTVGLIKNPTVRSTIIGWKDISAKVIDETTIEFSMQSQYAAFEHVLNFPILPEHMLGGVAPASIRESSFSKNPIGSGPFKISLVQDVDLASGRKVIYMTRSANYHRGVARIERFQLNVYGTNDEIIRALSQNEVNAAADLYPADISRVDKTRYDISSEPINSGVYAILNTKSSFLNDVNLRRALQAGTNTSAIRADLPAGTLALDLPIVNRQLTGDLPKAPQFDPVAAKKILDDAGWIINSQGIREKDGRQLKLTVVTMKNSEFERALEILTGQWRSLGVAVETKVSDPNDSSQNVGQNVLQPRAFDVFLYRLNIGGDPDVYAYWHSSQATAKGSNFADYSNAIGDDALSSARARFEPELRNAKYITFSKQWLADAPAIGLYQSTAQYVSSKNIQSFNKLDILNSPLDRYSDVLNWSVGTRSVYKTP